MNYSKVIAVVVFLMLLPKLASAETFRCKITDPAQQSTGPRSFMEIQSARGQVASVIQVSFAFNGSKFDELRRTLLSIPDQIRGGHKTANCIDDTEANASGGQYNSICRTILDLPEFDLLTVSLNFSKQGPGAFEVELSEKSSNPNTNHSIQFEACN